MPHTSELYSSFMADPHLKDTFTEGDIRLPLFQWMREGYLGYKKFHMRADDTADLVLMRAAEMYLIEVGSKSTRWRGVGAGCCTLEHVA